MAKNYRDKVWRAIKSPELVFTIIILSVFFTLILGHEGLRLAKLLVLYLPYCFLIFIFTNSGKLSWIGKIFVWLVTLTFYIDAIARYYLRETYDAAPDSALVLNAVANTNLRESIEYALANSVLLICLGLLLFFFAAISLFLLISVESASRSYSRAIWYSVVLLMTFSLVAHANKPWRKLHPIIFWKNWMESISLVQAEWANQVAIREEQFTRAKAMAPKVERKGNSTIVLVIADSINRDNLGIYGYPRNTTPMLSLKRRDAGKNMVIFRNSWSLDASTIPAFERMFSLQAAPDNSLHLLAMARSAGYKTWWVSNHDDVAIESRHASYADIVELINRTPGRSSSSLDGEILNILEEALKDKAKNKFIIVHLLGAHPHYNLRYPKNENPFDNTTDDVDREMQAKNRSFWVRGFREQYDAALLYHDSVISKTLDLVKNSENNSDYQAWMYLSDHGQEVGHLLNKVGHSPSTESGYRIPTIIWRNRIESDSPDNLGERGFRSDWASWTVADLLSLQWEGKISKLNILSEDYQWIAPKLPFPLTEASPRMGP
ncbi:MULTISPECIES: sulfatase-like hydrolase/transferase [Delftia]|uniref:Heptose-I-phosphate ethanolaminephosphotransferase n=1 Tax=Delftia lacustris TaxID=558537 RepID=A0A1H3U7N8_9BURK|nr:MULTISPECIES: phosphoethanolamine transferase [Delftia]EPD37945.1 hypothetical protein HMPREF9701_04015 [Delftia acidovorans CCUG 274B]SDZ57815.1 heptose-I-phosphate ethanolaminephosphotransferase [Delftia lacustris]